MLRHAELLASERRWRRHGSPRRTRHHPSRARHRLSTHSGQTELFRPFCRRRGIHSEHEPTSRRINHGDPPLAQSRPPAPRLRGVDGFAAAHARTPVLLQPPASALTLAWSGRACDRNEPGRTTTFAERSRLLAHCHATMRAYIPPTAAMTNYEIPPVANRATAMQPAGRCRSPASPGPRAPPVARIGRLAGEHRCDGVQGELSRGCGVGLCRVDRLSALKRPAAARS